MAPPLELKKIETPETTPTLTAECREGSISNTDDAKAPSPDPKASGSKVDVDQAQADKGVKDVKKKKKVSVKCAKKHKKVAEKSTKKSRTALVSSSESSDDDSEDEESSEESSEDSDDSTSASESAPRVQGKKAKRGAKKRQEAQKAKKKPKLKKSKRQTKTEKAPSDLASDEEDSDDSSAADTASGSSDEDDNDTNGNTTSKGGSKSRKPKNDTTQQQIQQLQIQVQQLSRQIPSINLGSGGGSGYPSGGGMGAGGLGHNSLSAASFSSPGFHSGLNVPYGGFHTFNSFPGSGSLAGLGSFEKPLVPPPRGRRAGRPVAPPPGRILLDDEIVISRGRLNKSKSRSKRSSKVLQRLEFKRVDHVWDSQIHNYKLQDTAENTNSSHYDEYLFHVRRTFDWEGKYKVTIIDIKSKQLREALQDVMGNIKGVSLVEETPKLDPNMLFLYLEDLREHMKNLKELEPDGKTRKERKKVQKWIDEKRSHLKVLVKYLDKDYSHVKKSLYPLLENGLITFDLAWALWKPNTLAFTTTYGSVDEPRVFKVEVAEKHFSIVKGDFYYIEGKYFEYDGKQFGYGSMSEEIGDFRGARKITSLGCYPLKYHKNEDQVRNDLVERGKKFVDLSGVNYKSHQGMAYYKKKKSVIKVNINGRVMIDPAIHRRNNPNYPISLVRPKDHDILSDDEDDDSDDEGGCCDNCESDSGGGTALGLVGDEDDMEYVTKVYTDKEGNISTIRVPKDEVTAEAAKQTLDKVPSKTEIDEEKADEEGEKHNDSKSAEKGQNEIPEFTDEEYLIASPVVLGFAFAEKLWLEFTVSGVKEIQWNEQAYDSLVLETKTKDIVKALVESHKYHAAESIDDVIQGKGKGLVAVLHGPPGTGKTLTAEGISELLRCPLYMVSAGDLGTDSRYLEAELQKTLDICHAWGAILLLDEADVFLEKRNMHDIHRNALVSIFLRQLEYFQGILFLTTNRVETFDDAFQSRIHIALRYDELDTRAKKAIFKIFIERVRVLEKIDLMPFTEEDYNMLARHDLNGRQIKNTIRTAQALAVNKGEALSMRHIREVLDVLSNFERDLRGGTGYQDAMRSYF